MFIKNVFLFFLSLFLYGCVPDEEKKVITDDNRICNYNRYSSGNYLICGSRAYDFIEKIEYNENNLSQGEIIHNCIKTDTNNVCTVWVKFIITNQ